MLARGALQRLAAEVPKQATHDLPKLASLVQAIRGGRALPIRTLSRVLQLQSSRSYATTTTTTTTASTATKPTATAKKAVKPKAAAGKPVKKTATKKKAASKKAAPKKAKKKAAPKKAAPKKRVKKLPTPEEKEAKAITELRRIALKEPVSKNPVSAYNVYLGEHLKDAGGEPRAQLAEAVAKWKNITPAEHERYNQLAAERNEARAAEYQAWIKSHTPEQIRLANNARRQLRKKLDGNLKSSKHTSHTQLLIDDRRARRAASPWALFIGERISSNDFHGIKNTDRFKLLMDEWKALDASKKQKYEDESAANQQRYARERAAVPSE